MRLLAALAAIAILSATAAAQNPGWTPPPNAQWEYGTPAELKGVRRIFVDAGLDLVVRQRVVDEIRKEVPDMEVLPTPAGAEALLILLVDRQTSGALVSTTHTTVDPNGNATSQTTTYPSTSVVVTYDGYVAKPVAQDRFRLLFGYDRDAKTRTRGETAAAVASHVPLVGIGASFFNRRERSEIEYAKKFGRQFVKEWKSANPGYKKPKRARKRANP